MYTQKNVLLATNINEDTSFIEELCFKHNYGLTKLYNICDIITAVSEYNYQLLILDYEHYFNHLEILSLFKRKNYFVNDIILLTEENNLQLNTEFKQFCKYDIKSLKDYFESINKNCIEYENNSFLINCIEQQLIMLGFLTKYKGFDYMVEIVALILKKQNNKKSFRKYVYPFISNLFNVTSASVERDIRNLIGKNDLKMTLLKTYFDQNTKPTTRNTISAIILHMKKYFNKLSNVKINP